MPVRQGYKDISSRYFGYVFASSSALIFVNRGEIEMDVESEILGIGAAETEADLEQRVAALDKLLEQFEDHIVYWDGAGFEMTGFRDSLSAFQKKYDGWAGKKGRNLDSLDEMVSTNLRDLYDEFFVSRDRINRAQLLLEEAEELYRLDKKVPIERIRETTWNLTGMDDIEERMKGLRQMVYKNNDIDGDKLKRMALRYVRQSMKDAQRLREKGINVSHALGYLNKCKRHFAEDRLDEAIQMCRLAQVELKYHEGLYDVRMGKGRLPQGKDEEAATEEVIEISPRALEAVSLSGDILEGMDEKAIAELCTDVLVSTKESMRQLSEEGKSLRDLYRMYMKVKPVLVRGEYRKALKLALEVHQIVQGMMAPPPTEEELKAGRYTQLARDYDFDIFSEEYHTPEATWDDDEEGSILEFECSECGAYVPGNAETCPKCGEYFLEVEMLPEEDITLLDEDGETKEGAKEGAESDAGKEELEEKKEPASTAISVREAGAMAVLDDDDDDEDDEESVISDEVWKELDTSMKKKAPPEDQVFRFITKKLREAEDLAKAGKLKEALDILNMILNVKSDHPAALNDKGTILYSMGEKDKALVLFDMAIEANPKFVEGWTNKGYLLHDMGNPTGAFYCYERALALNPNNIEVLTNIGALNFDSERYDRALRYFEKATEVNPGDADLWNYRGYTNELLERWGEALAAYDRTISIDPQHPEATSGRQSCMEKLGKETMDYMGEGKKDESYPGW